MKLALLPLAAAALAAALAGCAADSSAPPRIASADRYATDASARAGACFRLSQMRNHTIADDQTLYVSAGSRDVYRLDMSGACLAGATGSDPLIIKPTASTDLICKPLDLDLRVRVGPGMASPCIIRAITPLTPAEVAALPPKLRP